MESIDPTVVGIAVVFSVPPGIGIWLATLRVTGGRRPGLAAIAGLAMGLLLFLAVVLLAGFGHPEEPV